MYLLDLPECLYEYYGYYYYDDGTYSCVVSTVHVFDDKFKFDVTGFKCPFYLYDQHILEHMTQYYILFLKTN